MVSKKKNGKGKEKSVSGKTGSKNFPEKIINYFNEKEKKIRDDKKKQFIFFVLGFLVIYLVISFIVGLVPQSVFKQGTGEMAQFLLEAQGIKTNTIGLAECKEYSWITDSINDECYSFSTREEQKTIIISWLCTGITEIIILIGAILASFGVNWRKRVIGAIAAIPAGIIFNLLRIWITINIILSQSIQTVELAHDFLFKIMLFIYVVVFYVIWFYWAERKEK